MSLSPDFFDASLDSQAPRPLTLSFILIQFYTLCQGDFIPSHGLSISRPTLSKTFSTGALCLNRRMQNATRVPVFSVLLRTSAILDQGRDAHSFQTVEALGQQCLIL